MCDAERAHTHHTQREHTLTREVGCSSLGRDFFFYILFICDWEAILFSVKGLLLGSCQNLLPALSPQPGELSLLGGDSHCIAHPPSVLQLNFLKTVSSEQISEGTDWGNGIWKAVKIFQLALALGSHLYIQLYSLD